MSSALQQILKRLELLERRIARLEAAAGLGRAAAQASNANAFRNASRTGPASGELSDEARASPSGAAAGASPRPAPAPSPPLDRGSVADAPITERLDRVPAMRGDTGDPFPDLSLLDEKLEPKKGPAEHLQVRAALEDNPRISTRIQQLWGTPDCEAYLNTLVIDTRGNRKGFPPAMLEELLYLGRLARALVILQVGGDLWDTYDQVGDRR